MPKVRTDHERQRLDEYVQRTVDAAPPLTPAQRDRIAALIHGGRP